MNAILLPGSILWQRVKALSYPLHPLPTERTPTSTPLPGIRAVWFDVYGTLLISGSGEVGTVIEESYQAALIQAMDATGHEFRDDGASYATALFHDAIHQHHASCRAAGIAHPEIEVRDIWRFVTARLRERGLVNRMLAQDEIERLALEYECRVNPVWPMPHALHVLKLLRQHNVALGIVSNAQFYTPIILHVLLHYSLDELGFDPAFCSWSYRLGQAKPSRFLFAAPLRAAELRGLQPHEILYVGNDMLNDVYTASACGLRTCLFAGDARSLREREGHEEVKGLEPDLVITALDQLPGLV